LRTVTAGAILVERRLLSKNVTYCTNSTITEAWTFVHGLPAAVNDAEMGALRHAAQKQLPGLKVLPGTVVVRRPQDGLAPPFWVYQLTWDDGRLRARLGHRYLSVHYLRRVFSRRTNPSRRIWLFAGTIVAINWRQVCGESFFASRARWRLLVTRSLTHLTEPIRLLLSSAV